MTSTDRGCWFGLLLTAVAALILLSARAHAAATITIQIDPSEPPLSGFTDPTPVLPVGSNTAVTLGGQRLFVFQTAANQWGKLLNSAVTIAVNAKMTSIMGGCNGSSAILGQAGPNGAYANFANAPKANVFYPVALADSLKGSANGAGTQIDATFNVDIDTGTCLTGNTWWYDTNPADPKPSGKIALLPVVFHELGHGLGFITFTNLSNGSFVSIGGGNFLPDIWDLYLFDLGQNKTWTQINPTGAANATIVGSAINDPNLVWAGRRVNEQTKEFLTGSPLSGTQSGCMRTHAPTPLVNGSSVSHWTTAANPHLLMQPALNQSIFNTVDLTLPAFGDIGWSTNPEDILFVNGFDLNRCSKIQP